MNFKEIIKLYLSDNGTLHLEVGFFVLSMVIVWFIILILQTIWGKKSLIIKHDIELNITLGGIGGINIKPNHEVSQIAHKAWTELVTRKAGLPFDLDNDVIVEVYNSWYVLFGEIRNLVKQIPTKQIKDENTQKLVDLLVDSLNKGLRPHLTIWQAKFRRWYMNETEGKNFDKTPQEIQKMYPQYQELVQDLIIINQHLVEYTKEIRKLIK
jgi:hypothetical protein